MNLMKAVIKERAMISRMIVPLIFVFLPFPF